MLIDVPQKVGIFLIYTCNGSIYISYFYAVYAIAVFYFFLKQLCWLW